MNKSIKNTIKTVIPDPALRVLRQAKFYLPSEIMQDIRINSYITKNAKKRKGKIIKVAFVVQMAEIWDKESPIYDAMLEDGDFLAHIIVVPEYDQMTGAVRTEYNNNYFISNYPEAICAYSEGKWLDLEERAYDYIFLQRPYDQYLPKGFRSSDLVKHTKLCYVPYGYSAADIFSAGNTNKTFFRNIYFNFLESDHMVQLMKKRFLFPGEKRNHKVLNLGAPSLIPYFDLPKDSNQYNILWTPRWSFDPVIGKSTFLKYKDMFISLAKDYPEAHFDFRPHPLLLGELVKKNILPKEEVEGYMKKLEEIGVDYDQGKPIIDTFQKTDVLITDLSSIILQFFITGRPIIYCEAGFKLNAFFSRLAEGFYIANNAEDIKRYVDHLTKGFDPLYETRKRIIEKDLQFHINSTSAILNAIRTDYYKQ